ncbi:sialate O-acetylesterase [Jiulongibacter sp. NS-SX5]|uniref:sialate O-acetylesterase n=1 Tax=Jiulongibacter sp. NS-SX5 TaxID=3463854 RepID=UPI004058D53C
MRLYKKALLYLILLFGQQVYAQSLDITFPSNRAVFQRNNGNVAIVYFAGNYRTRLDKIEIKLEAVQGGQSKDWSTLVDRPNFGTYRGSLVISGGWYTAKIRGIFNGQVIAETQVDRFGVGEVFLISGQSNAQGYFGRGQRGAYDDRVNVVSNFLNEGFNKPPYPVFGHLDAESAMAPTGKGAWYWGELGDLLTQKLNVPVLFMNAAWEGFPAKEFVKSSQGERGVNPYSFNSAPNGYPFGSIEDALHYYTNLTGLRAILWHQGESDNYLNTSFESYASDLNKIISDTKTRTGKDITWMVARASKDASRFYQPVIDAQNHVININGNVFAGPNTDLILDRSDGVHFSTTGLSKAANSWNEHLNFDFFSRSQPQFGNPPLQVQQFCGLPNKSRPMFLSAPIGYVSYEWNNGTRERTLSTGPASVQGLAKDIYGNVYYSFPMRFDNSMLPTKPSLTAEGPTEFCEGGSVVLKTNNSFNNYWSTGQEAKQITVSNSADIHITHINLYSCDYTSDPLPIRNLPTPKPEIIPSGPTDICSDQQLTLQSNLTNGVIWNTGETHQTLDITQAGVYSLKARNEFGCEGESDPLEVTIKPAAQKPTVENIGPDILCESDSTILRVSNTQNMRWSTGESSIEKSVKTTGEYYATNTNEFGCQANSELFNIVVNPKPETPSIEVLGNLEVCDDEQVKMKASPAYAYHWNNGFDEQEIEVNISREIFLRTSNEYGCFSDPSEPKGVVILDKPKNPNILQTGTFTLKSVFSTDTTNLYYHWILESDTVSYDKAFLKARKSGNYQVFGEKVYQLSNGGLKSCISSVSEPFQFYISDQSDGFSAYPNPVVNRNLTVETLEDVDRATVTVFSLDGKPYFSEYVDIFDAPKNFDLGKLPSGKYILQVRNNRSKFFRKIMIEQP